MNLVKCSSKLLSSNHVITMSNDITSSFDRFVNHFFSFSLQWENSGTGTKNSFSVSVTNIILGCPTDKDIRPRPY